MLPLLKELNARTVHLAFDNDAADNAHVGQHLSEFAQALTADGFEIALEVWPTDFKGIDDALVGGAEIGALTGDEAKQAIADILASATSDSVPDEPLPIARLNEVLTTGGPVAFFRDQSLLKTLAKLAEKNPAEFAVCRARLNSGGVKLRDLDSVLAPLRREIRMANPPPDAGGQYRISGGRIVHDVLTKDGIVETPLTNWAGRIVEELVVDDGADKNISLAIEGVLADGSPLARTEVGADEFPSMRWPVARWGIKAVVLAGAGTADHTRTALQLLSGDVPRRVVFAHSGWREIAGQWVFLHGNGALGALGSAVGIETALPKDISPLSLPDPPKGQTLVMAIRASLGLLTLGSDKIVFPCLCAVYRAVLAPPTSRSISLVNPATTNPNWPPFCNNTSVRASTLGICPPVGRARAMRWNALPSQPKM